MLVKIILLLFILFPNRIFSFHDYWTKLYTPFINTTESSQSGKGCLKYFTDLQNQPPSVYGSYSFLLGDRREDIYLYGGYGYECYNTLNGMGLLNQFWKYNIPLDKWVMIGGAYTKNGVANYTVEGKFDVNYIPGAMFWGCSWELGNGNAQILGGRTNVRTSSYQSNELWEVRLNDEEKVEWAVIRERSGASYGSTFGEYSGNANVFATEGHACAMGINQTAFIMGGYLVTNGDYWVHNLWQYNTITDQYRVVGGPQSPGEVINGVYGDKGVFSLNYYPSSRYGHVLWSAKGNAYIWGGISMVSISGTQDQLGDLWCFNITLLQYAYMTGVKGRMSLFNPDTVNVLDNHFDASNYPVGRKFAVGWRGFEDYLYLGFGFLEDPHISRCTHRSNDVWIYSVSLNSWKYLNQSGDWRVEEYCTTDPGSTEYPYMIPSRDSALVWVVSLKDVYIGFGRGGRNDIWRLSLFDSECSGNGESTVDGCVCFDNYYGEICELWYCGGVLNNFTEVCHTRGFCKDYNFCDCEYGYSQNTFCKDFECYSHIDNEITPCDNKGLCLSIDVCDCEDDYYGRDCKEYIKNPVIRNDDLVISYVTYKSLLSYDMLSGLFQCSKILRSVGGLLVEGSDIKCYFVFKDEDLGTISKTTSFLYVQLSVLNLDFPVSDLDGEILTIIPITAKSDDNTAEFTITLEPNDLSLYYYIAAGGSGLLLIIIVVLCITLFLCILSSMQKRKLKKFAELEDFELLLEEQHAQHQTSSQGPSLKINKELFRVNINDIQLEKEIAHGASGVVYLAKELSLISSLKHPHIIVFYGVSITYPRIGLILEYCPNGNLKGLISLNALHKDKRVKFNEKIRILFEIASAMSYLHQKRVIHRDLKTENVLIDNEMSMKLIDFGLSRILDSNDAYLTKRLGTSHYMAPEITMGKGNYDGKIDVFSFGIVMYELLFDKALAYGDLTYKVSIETKVGINPKFRPVITEEMKKKHIKHSEILELLVLTWDHSPSTRPTFKTILEILNKYLNTTEKVSDDKKLMILKRNTSGVNVNEQDNNFWKTKCVKLEKEIEVLKKENLKLKKRK